jgi:hypothetical protein
MSDELDPYQELVKEKSPYLFCDYCGFYPIEPEHAHFRCPACKMPTTCCEGAPVEITTSEERHIAPENLRSDTHVPRSTLRSSARFSNTLHHSSELLDEGGGR